MRVDQIREISINSARKYFAFLDKNGKGVEEIKVRDITRENDVIQLKLEGAIFNPESIKYRIHNKEYTLHEIPQLMYDIDNQLLSIQPLPEYIHLFTSLNLKDIIIVSDLKFLVKRVEDWYYEYGSRIQLPPSIPSLNYDIEYDSNHQPSEEQIEAIRNILSTSFSYVWGAPGTGKTKFVLSHCIVQYLKAGKRIAVFAPTNNALEQVLYGVLEMLKQYNIKTDKVLRLGTPSKKFALDYPEVCENIGIQKKIEELKAQINNFNSVRDLKNTIKYYNILTEIIIPKMKELKLVINQYDEASGKLEKQSSELLLKQRLLGNIQDEIHKKMHSLDEIEIKLNSTIIKIRAFFNKKQFSLLEKQKERFIEELKKKNNELDDLREKINSLEVNNITIQEKLEKEKSNSIDLINEIFACSEFIGKAKDLFSGLSISNYSEVMEKVNRKKQEAENYIELKKAIVGDLLELSAEDVENRLQELNCEVKKLYESSTQKRIKDVSVIAATVDSYLSKFTFNKDESNKLSLDVDHIFLDEAGYCNLIKGVTLLAKGCPITFLGDHMQLPPVCEMDDSEMKREMNSEVFLWAQSAIYVEELFSKDKNELLESYIRLSPPSFNNIVKSNLTATYRFGKGLSSILNQYVYKNGFTSALKDKQFDFKVINVAAKRGEKRRENPAEAEAIRKFVSTLNGEDFSILAPYKDQVGLIKKLLPDVRKQQRIMTVHKSQGREWDTVILSVSDTSNKYFTDSLKIETKGLMLMNTAVSRAKKRLVIVCDCDYWSEQKGQLITGLIGIR